MDGSILRSGKFLLEIHNLLNLHQEPAVDLREVEKLLAGEAGAEGVADEEDAFPVGHAQFAADDVAREDVAVKRLAHPHIRLQTVAQAQEALLHATIGCAPQSLHGSASLPLREFLRQRHNQADQERMRRSWFLHVQSQWRIA